ncbi:MAG: sigma-54 interaction domain-containing protein [Acetobacteraceae bacterium]
MRVTVSDLTRLPAEVLARLLLECAAESPGLLGRLHESVSRQAPAPLHASAPARLIGESPAMHRAGELIVRFARTEEPVLITGESGTGKELAARAIHEGSSRHGGPFVAVNCAAIPPSLVASELFGYEKGAFTGAAARTKGQIEHADGGTLFLDEVGDMPVDMQGHLLRFLQEGQIVRVGGRETVSVNVRVVAATNVRLREAIMEGRFREDLYYRLNVLLLPLPPLRERGGDVELLARHLLQDAARQFQRAVHDFEPAALAALLRNAWPGNVRELAATIRRAVVIGDGPLVRAADLVGLDEELPAPHAHFGATPVIATPFRPQPGSADERATLLHILSVTGENVTLTAQQLGVSRVTLYRMLRRHAINLNRGLRPVPAIN